MSFELSNENARANACSSILLEVQLMRTILIHLLLKVSNMKHATPFLLIAVYLAAGCCHVSAAAAASATAVKSRSRSAPRFLQKPFGVMPTNKRRSRLSDDRQPRRIIVMGGPASGKGTVCETIKDRFGLVHLSTGDMLRSAVADQTEVGLLAKEYMDTGRLVPDEIIVKLVRDRINQPDCQERGYLLDGFPRTRQQAIALKTMGIEPDTFLFLEVNDENLVERIIGRRLDPVDGSIYHLKFKPPPEEIVDRLVTRSDDTEEKAKSRLSQFHTHASAVKSIFQDILVTVDGSGSPDAVSQQIRSILENGPVKCAA